MGIYALTFSILASFALTSGARADRVVVLQLLADAGADVVKLEPPEGDPLRRWTASDHALAPGEDGALFQYLHTNKRSGIADLATEEGRALTADLVEEVARKPRRRWQEAPRPEDAQYPDDEEAVASSALAGDAPNKTGAESSSAEMRTVSSIAGSQVGLVDEVTCPRPSVKPPASTRKIVE